MAISTVLMARLASSCQAGSEIYKAGRGRQHYGSTWLHTAAGAVAIPAAPFVDVIKTRVVPWQALLAVQADPASE